MICPICGKEGRDDAKFCGKCGKKIPRCPTCGTVLTKPVRFCLQDATPIPEEIRSLFPEAAATAAPVVLPVIPKEPEVTAEEPVQEELPVTNEPAHTAIPTPIPAPIPDPISDPIPAPIPTAVDRKPGKPVNQAEKKVREKKEKKKPRFLMVILIVLVGLLAGAAAGSVGYMAWQHWDEMPWVAGSDAEPSRTEGDFDDEEHAATEEQSAESVGAEETLPAETTMPTEAVAETLPVEETQSVMETVPPTTAPPAEPVYVSTYEVVAGDLSWHEAKLACEERGGTLVCINSAEEFQEICGYAESSGLRYLWLGACLYSAEDEWTNATWLSGEPWTFEAWYPGEPSKEDADGTKEYYLCLWNAKYENEEIGWTMNDQRSDIVADFPTVSGKIGYICEYRVEVTG